MINTWLGFAKSLQSLKIHIDHVCSLLSFSHKLHQKCDLVANFFLNNHFVQERQNEISQNTLPRIRLQFQGLQQQLSHRRRSTWPSHSVRNTTIVHPLAAAHRPLPKHPHDLDTNHNSLTTTNAAHPRCITSFPAHPRAESSLCRRNI